MKHSAVSVFRRISAVLLAAGAALTLASCSAKNAAADSRGKDYALFDAPMEMETYAETTAAADYEMIAAPSAMGSSYDKATADSASGRNSSAETAVSKRKLIKNVTMELETLEFDSFVNSLEARISAAGGYVESSSIRGSGTHRTASVTARIPAEELDSFTSGVSEIANVVMRSENTNDVSRSYYDMESHVKALRSEYETLIGILEKCTELKDVISVQSRITEVLYQIESYQSQLNNYDSLVAYSTVRLYISEVERETVVVEPGLGGRISDGLARTVDNIVDDLEDFVVDLTVNLPYLLIWAVIIAASVLVLRALIRRWNRRMKKIEKKDTEKKDGE